MKLNYLFIALISISLASCADAPPQPQPKEDQVESKGIDKDGAVISEITTERSDKGFDVIVTKYSVWNNNLLSKEITHRDTVLALGKMPKAAGDTTNVDKHYAFYITVK
ncbi:MAG: hypothetical protein RIS64_1122 [Bacteroidota bacterium]|jgi:hypothetical protein